MNDPAVRLNLRPLANPLPLGLYSFGIGMMLLAAQSAGWVPAGQGKQMGVLLVAFVFPLEGLGAIFAFLARDTLAATVLGLFTGSWLSSGLSLILGHPGAPSLTQGFYLLAFAAPVIVLALLAFTGKPLIALMLTLSATRAILDGLYNVSATVSLEHASGYVAAVIAGAALYGGSAFLLEDLRQHAVLPVWRRGASRAAMQAPLAAQIDRVPGEAGIRQQL